MRFNILIAVSLLWTLASGLTIPANTLSARDADLEVRESDFLGDSVDIAVREPGFLSKAKSALKPLSKVKNAFKPTYKVKAGGGKPAQRYSHHEVKQAVADANHEHQRLKNASKTQKKKSPLKVFNNNNHHLPKKSGAKHAKTFPKMKGTGHEYPLPNKNGGTGKGPARVIMKEKNDKLKLHGVVAHDQSRPTGSQGANDHFKVKGKINPFKKH
ncbi:hypothetical protein CPC08DRAFT_814052 [Agrocybe pediades]|nr:hypothetical protein CPC08DRAFT_814052 [Agrocybe pediades]